jgi:K+/H+ antiporter YhaU regulatory subunit KhtT
MQRYLVRSAGPLVGKSIGHVMRAYAMLVVQHSPVDGEPALCPDPETVLRAGDGVLLQGALSTLERFRRKSVGGAMMDGGRTPVGAANGTDQAGTTDTADTTGD